MQRQGTSFIFHEDTHIFTVVLPDKCQCGEPSLKRCSICNKPTWEQAIQHYFPGAIREEAFVKTTYAALNNLGFYNYNTLSCVSLCRDEMCSPLLDLIDQHWKAPFIKIRDEEGKSETLYTHSFLMSSLAGMLFLGVTGMKAATSHAPHDKEGRQKYVFYAFPHIGISDKGILGEVERPGHDNPSTACGALVHLHEQLKEEFLHLESDPNDVEYSLMKQRLLKRMPLFSGKVPSIKSLTELTYQAILEDLEKLIEIVVKPENADYAVLTGIQVHSPGGASYIWEGEMYTVISGKRENLVI